MKAFANRINFILPSICQHLQKGGIFGHRDQLLLVAAFVVDVHVVNIFKQPFRIPLSLCASWEKLFKMFSEAIGKRIKTHIEIFEY